MSEGGIRLSEAGRILFGVDGRAPAGDTQRVLDAAAQAMCPDTGTRLLPWRAHVFHRSQGGLWVCVDPSCVHRDAELSEPGSGWRFGAVWLRESDRCECGAPVFELFACSECGMPHLLAGRELGVTARLVPPGSPDTDEFAVDAEPEPDENGTPVPVQDQVMLLPARGESTDCFLRLEDRMVFENGPPADGRWIRLELKEDERARGCCAGARRARLAPQRYGPAFLMGTALPGALESLARPYDEPGRPMGGRRALTFSDSRQGTARLAAKLQQDAERSLTRAFLYHAVQQGTQLQGAEREMLEKKLAFFRAEPEVFADDIREVEEVLGGRTKPVGWNELVSLFARQTELSRFATEVWRERTGGGREMADDPRKLAQMFLYRELARRPRVQNNAETMGLVRLCFPELEARGRERVPRVLADAGIEPASWTALALAVIDFVFRDRLAVWLPEDWMMRFVSPRSGGHQRSICRSGIALADRPEGSLGWPGPVPSRGRPSRMLRLVYGMIGGDPDDRTDQDRAGQVLRELWTLITSTAARDIGGGAFQIDFESAAVARVEEAWICPVTRRIMGYSPNRRSSYDPDREMAPVRLPRLPRANPGGLAPDERADAERWCRTAEGVVGLRRQGMWTDLHDRAATYMPFVRSQEHSAQIERPVLAYYEELFEEGRINLLNCSTTMEMGVDIPNVELIANSNVPPSVANYRQRLGRAGRRGEPWAFGITFCRELPLDRIVFDEPERFLASRVTAPKVNLDSPGLVARHVNAAFLGAFLRDLPDGFNVRASTGAFFGATDEVERAFEARSVADDFLEALRGQWSRSGDIASTLKHLTKGTAFDGSEPSYLAERTARAFERMLERWQKEYAELLARRDAADEREVKQAFATKARRMKGEFLLGELARRGFTPAYGFPVDVVAFDHLSGHDRGGDPYVIEFGDRRGGASRTLDIAIREYAPGADVVVDGLVHRSEGVLPAWVAMADESGLEDLQVFWDCSGCLGFGLTRIAPERCPDCGTRVPLCHRTLRPAGFLGRRAPHTGYESLGHVPYEMPRLSASGSTWRTLPDPLAGRWRADAEGQVVTFSSGAAGRGYALCLECGRAVAETGYSGDGTPLPGSMGRHRPLAPLGGKKLRGGYCPGGFTKPERVQRNVKFIHGAKTDVFELQLPKGTGGAGALAVAAGLREALAQRLGAEAREIGVAIGVSRGSTNTKRISAYLHDRASGGAGLSSRLAEQESLGKCIALACERLACPEDCTNGCPACVMRPDLNFGDAVLDRRGGLRLVHELRSRLELPDELRVFGTNTRILGEPLTAWLERRRRSPDLESVTLFLHGLPGEWELGEWVANAVLKRLNESDVRVATVLASEALLNREMTFGQKLDLYRLSLYSSLAVVSELPVHDSVRVVAAVREGRGLSAIGVADPLEGVAGPCWATGKCGALVRGPAPELPTETPLDAKKLIRLASGNAQLIRAGSMLDGRISDFGRSFWKMLESHTPLAVSMLSKHGVESATYSDRYLLTPLAFRLFIEVFRRMPGRNGTRLRVATGRLSGKENEGWAVFHSFNRDETRRAVLSELLPGARVSVGDRTQLPHERRLTLRTRDGREVIVLLDQGFGAWRAEGVPGHDFSAPPGKQARALEALEGVVEAEAGRDIPIVVELTGEE